MSAWTTEKPTEPGYYWLRYKENGGTSAVEVVRYGNMVNGAPRYGLAVRWFGGGKPQWLDEFDAIQVDAWAHAIPPPREATP